MLLASTVARRMPLTARCLSTAPAVISSDEYTVGVVGAGRLFTWGSDKESRLGRKVSPSHPAELPFPVSDHKWKQVRACGRVRERTLLFLWCVDKKACIDTAAMEFLGPLTASVRQHRWQLLVNRNPATHCPPSAPLLSPGCPRMLRQLVSLLQFILVCEVVVVGGVVVIVVTLVWRCAGVVWQRSHSSGDHSGRLVYLGQL
jgi:hypothetical protein